MEPFETRDAKERELPHETEDARKARWATFQKCALVPAFRELRRRAAFATVQRLSCCQSCAHAELSEQYVSCLFFHVQDKDRCIETTLSRPLQLHLGFHFERVDVEARALAILKKHCRVEWSGDYGKCIIVSPKVPPSVRWAVVRSWVRKRSIAVYWKAMTAHLYDAGGVGRKRDLEAFEGDPMLSGLGA